MQKRTVFQASLVVLASLAMFAAAFYLMGQPGRARSGLAGQTVPLFSKKADPGSGRHPSREDSPHK